MQYLYVIKDTINTNVFLNLFFLLWDHHGLLCNSAFLVKKSRKVHLSIMESIVSQPLKPFPDGGGGRLKDGREITQRGTGAPSLGPSGFISAAHRMRSAVQIGKNGAEQSCQH